MSCHNGFGSRLATSNMWIIMHRALPAFTFLGLLCSLTFAEESLHDRIDRLVSAQFQGEPAPLTDDAAFLRRVHLDLAGCIPSAEKTRQFLADTAADKRELEIDRLLASPTYATRMANLFHVVLMERRGDNSDWATYLRTSFEANKPWDQLVREILHPTDDAATRRGAAYFYTQRLQKSGQNPTDYPGLTRDVGRLFLGVDLQCAECHDHLFIDDYKQLEFQGLFAAYKNISIRNEKFPAINEKSMTDKLEFISVFGSDKNLTGPRIPFGQEFSIPAPDPAADASAQNKKPDPNAPPAFSALQQLADNLPSADNSLFCQNIANRVWFLMMGRGLVEPLDQFHSANMASHPELLELLATEFAAHQFDFKWLIRELTLTDTYQRSTRHRAATEFPTPASYQLGQQRRLTAEQLFSSVLAATGNSERLTPAADADAEDPGQKLKAAFVTAVASEPKQPASDYKPSVKQALFFLNDSQVLALLQPHEGNLTAQLDQMPDAQVADTVFLNIFSRPPVDAERKLVEAHLQQHAKQRPEALRQLVWAMLTSLEFCINH